jgi:O-antigen/teichoic acid export membrane protein
MSTVTIIPSPSVSFPMHARRSRLFGKNIWAMGDQVLISATNFLTTILIARVLSPSLFGSFTLIYSALLLANIFQSTLVTQAHNVLALSRADEHFRRYTGNTLFSQIALVTIEAILALVVAFIAGAKGYPATTLILWLAPACVAWQMQEFVRRVMYTECRFAAAFWNDCLSYGGQMLLFALFWATGRLTGNTAMFSLTITSAAAAALGLWQIRSSLELKLDLAVFAENWTFGKWLLGGELGQWFGSLQLYLFMTAYLLGTHATGELRAAQTVFGPTRIFAFYLGSVLPIRFAKTMADKGPKAVQQLLRETCISVLPLLGIYCLLIAMFPHFLLQMIFGKDYAGTPCVLSFYAVYAFMSYAQTLLVAVLTARRQTRTIFMGNIYGTLITLAMSYWIIQYFKVVGAPIAIGVSCLITTFFFWIACSENGSSTETARKPVDGVLQYD